MSIETNSDETTVRNVADSVDLGSPVAGDKRSVNEFVSLIEDLDVEVNESNHAAVDSIVNENVVDLLH